MDAVAQMKETDIQTVLFPTRSAFAPLLEPKRDEISKARKTFKYGATERHQLDVYYPSNMGKKHPLLFYVYGGGFVNGERTLPAPADLSYGNSEYTSPPADLRDALAWATAHTEDLGSDADPSSVFFLGHSAGGVHTLTLLLEPTILAATPDLYKHIKGAMIASAPFHFEPVGHEMSMRKPTNMYYGSRETTVAHDPLALFRAAPGEAVATLPPLALLKCEYDPAWLKAVFDDFDKALGKRDVKAVLIFAQGHNHIIFSLALGTGQGEKWAEEAVAWMEAL
ncbi:Alpha/Beta hydrolase protein [Mycena capillaripes]|nr:Alpha/Beta hydrolase protein [Mycena capillaripes]